MEKKQKQEAQISNIEALIDFRHQMHKFAEPAWEEVETQKRIIAFLTENLGLPSEQIKKCSGTGVIVDLVG